MNVRSHLRRRAPSRQHPSDDDNLGRRRRALRDQGHRHERSFNRYSPTRRRDCRKARFAQSTPSPSSLAESRQRGLRGKSSITWLSSSAVIALGFGDRQIAGRPTAGVSDQAWSKEQQPIVLVRSRRQRERDAATTSRSRPVQDAHGRSDPDLQGLHARPHGPRPAEFVSRSRASRCVFSPE